MSTISELFSELKLSEDNKTKLQGYYNRLVRGGQYFKISRNMVILKDEKATKYLVLTYKKISGVILYLCSKCMNVSALEYI